MKKPVPRTQYAVGEWTVDPGLGHIRRSGISVDLEPRVMDLLEFLAGRAGETVSTDELADAVWAGRAVGDQPVYQGIAQLRKALGDDARRPRYIATVTKKGYRLVAPVRRSVADGNVAAVPSQTPSAGARQLRVAFLATLALGMHLLFASSDVNVPGVIAEHSRTRFETIAVLPFTDMSPGGDHQYLGDGIAEELIHRIAAISDVRVVARTSSFSFRDSGADVQEIGSKLGAQLVLEGSVRPSGEQLRVTAQLIDTSNGYHIWSQSFEPDLSDALHVQERIAAQVAQLLQSGSNAVPLAPRKWTHSARAADAYYAGLYHMHRRRAESLREALSYFRQSVSYDPEFALAYAALAHTFFLASDARYGNIPDDRAMINARATLAKAELLVANLPEVVTLRAVLAEDVHDLVAYARRAIEMNPNYAPAYQQYGWAMRELGRAEDEIAAKLKAVELDPLNMPMRVNLAMSYAAQNRHADSEAEFITAIEIDPDWHVTYFLFGLSLPEHQMVRKLGLFRKALTVAGPDARHAGRSALEIGYLYFTAGDYVAAERWYARAEQVGVAWPDLANRRVQLLLAQGRYAEADRLLDEWVSDDSVSPDIRLLTFSTLKSNRRMIKICRV